MCGFSLCFDGTVNVNVKDGGAGMIFIMWCTVTEEFREPDTQQSETCSDSSGRWIKEEIQ